MAQAKRKSKVKKVQAAKKKARIVRALKRHVAKARPAKKSLRKHVERARRLAPVAKGAKPLTGKPEDKAKGAKAPIKSAKQALELLEAKVNEVKVKGKRGRRGRKDEWLIPAELPKEDAETRRTRLKNLIKLGKERGFLTYSEINDHLPDDLVDAEQIEAIISTFGDMGIQVYDQAPDQEQLLIAAEGQQVAQPDEDVEEQAEAALSTVDSEFGRTTDPVRMYMREMGSVELLTRESEIEIAKRIEDGLKHMIQAISACPTTIAGILDLADKVEKDEMRVDELIDGLIDPDADEMVSEDITEESLEQELIADSGDDEDVSAVANANLMKLKNDALGRFGVIRDAYSEMQKALEKKGSSNKAYKDIQEKISSELMAIRFSAKMVERLCDIQRGLVDEMRGYERRIMELCVNRAGMQRNHFIKVFPGNESNLDWVNQEIAAGKPYSEALE